MEKGKENLVHPLKKSLHGLKQAPCQWYKKFESFMLEHGFNKTQVDHCVFVKFKGIIKRRLLNSLAICG